MALGRIKEFASKAFDTVKKTSNSVLERAGKMLPSSITRNYVRSKLVSALEAGTPAALILTGCDEDPQAKQEYQTVEQGLWPSINVLKHLDSGICQTTGGSRACVLYVEVGSPNDAKIAVGASSDPASVDNPEFRTTVSGLTGGEMLSLTLHGNELTFRKGPSHVEPFKTTLTIDTSAQSASVGTILPSDIGFLHNMYSSNSHGGQEKLLEHDAAFNETYLWLVNGGAWDSTVPTTHTTTDFSNCGMGDIHSTTGQAVGAAYSGGNCLAQQASNMNSFGGGATDLGECSQLRWLGDDIICLDGTTLKRVGAGSGPVCGNGTPETGEECDDGNTNNNDACTNSCETAECGDGFTQTGVEECDDGNSSDTDGCTNACETAECGDGHVQSGVEDCDDGNSNDNDACTNSCETAECGDGIIHVGVESCDGSNLGGNNCTTIPGSYDTGTLGCTAACDFDVSGCTTFGCGNGVEDPGEDCDDGNTNNNDACTNACEDATCGDGFTQTGVEECDDGNSSNTDGCTNACETAECGDGHVQNGVEDCDDANSNDNDACTNACETAECGDGIVHVGVEGCDNGSANSDTNPDACRENCQPASCGDSVKDSAEDCDGSVNGTTCEDLQYTGGGPVECDINTCEFVVDACTSDEICGNGIVAGPEDCEPGIPLTATCEDLDYDFGTLACSVTDCKFDTGNCSYETCGNGMLDTDVGELCDGQILDGASCEGQGFPNGGVLVCGPNCESFITDGCIEETPTITFDDTCAPRPYLDRFVVQGLTNQDNPFKLTDCTPQQSTLCGVGDINITFHIERDPVTQEIVKTYAPVQFEFQGEWDDWEAALNTDEDTCFTINWTLREGLEPVMLTDQMNSFRFVETEDIALGQGQFYSELRLSDGSSIVAGPTGTKASLSAVRQTNGTFERGFGEVLPTDDGAESKVTLIHKDPNGEEIGAVEYPAGSRFEFDNFGVTLPPDFVEQVESDDVAEGHPDVVEGADTTASLDTGNADLYSGVEEIVSSTDTVPVDTWRADTQSETPEAESENPDDCGCSIRNETNRIHSIIVGVTGVLLAAYFAGRRREEEEDTER